MKILTKIAMANNRENKTRSILIMAAVALTTMLITAIGTFGYGGMKGNVENAEILYGNYLGAFSQIEEEQLHEMEKRGEIDQIGLTAYGGEADTKGSSQLLWADEKALIMTNGYAMIREGKIPEKMHEIAASEAFFKQLGYENIEIGDEVIIPVRQNGKQPYQEEHFTVTGILQDGTGAQAQQSSTALISKAYYDDKTAGEDARYTAYFTLGAGVKGDWDEIKALLKDLAAQCGVDSKNLIENNNLISAKYAPTSEVLVPCIFIALIVVIFAAVVIYNIFQIGIARKIQEYGKIKAIGATRKQMKQIIVKEGMSLAVIAVPVGLAAGYFITTWMFNRAMNFAAGASESIRLEEVSLFSPWIILLSAAVSLVTVRVALIRAVKTVASITPVRAFTYEESAANQKGFRKGHKALRITGLIRSDLAANKKRNIITIVMMGLSCILFVAVASIASSIDFEYDARNSVERGDFQIELNYDNSDAVYRENNLDYLLAHDPISESVIEELRNTEGVTKIQTRNYLVFEKGGIKQSVAIFDRQGFEDELGKSGVIGDFSYDTVSRKNGYIYGYSHFMKESGQKIGDEISGTLSGGSSRADYTGTAMGAFGSVSADFIITEDTARKLGVFDNSYAYLWLWCDADARDGLSDKIRQMFDDNEHVYWESYEEAYDISERSGLLLKVFAYAFLILIGIICFLNMANTMIMNVITRKREWGILQAVGMSNRQLGSMLQSEGLLFTVGSVLISLLIGLPAGYAAFVFSKNEGFFGINVYHFPFPEVCAMIGVLFVMQMTLSFVLSRNVKKESVIDRIRY